MTSDRAHSLLRQSVSDGCHSLGLHGADGTDWREWAESSAQHALEALGLSERELAVVEMMVRRAGSAGLDYERALAAGHVIQAGPIDSFAQLDHGADLREAR